MTIREAIDKIDVLLHNTYSTEEKVAWLSKLDWMVMRQVILTHEGAAEVSFDGYGNDADMDTELLIPEPYCDAYIKWLEAQIHYTNAEYPKYNNAILMFNTEYEGYAADYNRTHRPITPGGNRFKF